MLPDREGAWCAGTRGQAAEARGPRECSTWALVWWPREPGGGRLREGASGTESGTRGSGEKQTREDPRQGPGRLGPTCVSSLGRRRMGEGQTADFQEGRKQGQWEAPQRRSCRAAAQVCGGGLQEAPRAGGAGHAGKEAPR